MTPRIETPSCDRLQVKVFADGAELQGMLQMAANPLIKGFTTNPTLMRKAGIADYRAFARDVLASITDRPISFEVFSDDFDEMEAQAMEIASWGSNVNVKIPVTNTRREFAGPLLSRLSRAGVALNVTAIMTNAQVQRIMDALGGSAPVFISVFAGRIADTGRDPLPIMREAVEQMRQRANTELIWASPRELLNIFQADEIGCQIITVTNDILKKLEGVGKDLDQFSLETVEMFRNDAVKAGYRIEGVRQ
jgi:transaldolase